MSSRFPTREHRRFVAALIGAVLGLASFATQKSAAEGTMTNSAGEPLTVPVTKLFPGGGAPPTQVPNAKKHQGNPVDIAAGRAIFDHYNCSGCHFHGAGGMGPPFMNGGHWIYGGELDQIFASIYQGRPNGMPSWGRTIPPQEIWDLAAYVKALSLPTLQGPTLPPLPRPTNAVAGGDAQHGAKLITHNGCGSCHQIPGIQDATGTVGPPLTGIAGRAVIAGVLPNTPGNMIAWIENPQAIVPGNAMPNLGLNDHEARDIAAYLATLH